MAAQEEARAAGNDRITSGHLVLGLLAEPESLAIVVLQSSGVTIKDLRAAATSALPDAATSVPELIPFDADAKKALELTSARRCGHNYVRTEHLLLALLELEAGDGVLSELGVEKPAVEASVVNILSALTPPDPEG